MKRRKFRIVLTLLLACMLLMTSGGDANPLVALGTHGLRFSAQYVISKLLDAGIGVFVPERDLRAVELALRQLAEEDRDLADDLAQVDRKAREAIRHGQRLEKDLKDVEGRVDALDTKTSELERELRGILDRIVYRVSKSEKAITEIRRVVNRLRDRVDDHEQRLASHGKQLASHDKQLVSHDEQLVSHDEQLVSHDEQLISHDEQLIKLDGSVYGLSEDFFAFRVESRRAHASTARDLDVNFVGDEILRQELEQLKLVVQQLTARLDEAENLIAQSSEENRSQEVQLAAIRRTLKKTVYSDDMYDMYVAHGIAMFRIGAYGQAREAFEDAHEFKRDEPGALYMAAMSLYSLGHTREALAIASRGVVAERKRPPEKWFSSLAGGTGRARKWLSEIRAAK